ncbi:MAG: hypothetical protein ACLFQA_06515, partial [Bacteroidales bacterium]
MNKLLKIILPTLLAGLLISEGIANSEVDSVRLMPEISFSGYIKSDFIFDSRQTVSVRENMLLLYPSPELSDETGADINDVSNFQFIPFQTRLMARFSGTEILNAKTSGLIEGEFFGNTDPTRNEFRLRHASITMEWQTGVSLLMGQYWHPLFITQCFPTTAGMNTGIPFNPFARSPQLEVSLKTDNFSFSAAAVSQIDFKSAGPQGAGTQYLRNSNLPELTGKIIYMSENNEFLIGAASSYKQLRPRIADATGNKVDETVGSASLMGFTKYNRGLTTLKMAGIIGQDMFHLTMLGGYAVRSDNSYTDTPLFSQPLYYTPVSTFSAWGEFIYGREWEFGLFTGYSKNLGTKED